MPKIKLKDNLIHDGEIIEQSDAEIDSGEIGLSDKQLEALVASGKAEIVEEAAVNDESQAIKSKKPKAANEQEQ